MGLQPDILDVESHPALLIRWGPGVPALNRDEHRSVPDVRSGRVRRQHADEDQSGPSEDVARNDGPPVRSSGRMHLL